MNNKMKNIFKTMLVMLTVACVSVVALTACSDDDDTNVVNYTMGFSKMSSSDFGALYEMNTIEIAFQKELKVNGSTFTKSGSNAYCDKMVYEACQKAVESLKDQKWNGNYTFTVTNLQTGRVVYEVEFQP